MCLDTKWKGWLTAAFAPSGTTQWLENNEFKKKKRETQNVSTPNTPKKYKKVSEGKKYFSFNNVVGS